VFNPEKLDWFNQQHIARLAPDELARRLKPLLETAQLWDESYLTERHAWFFGVLELLKPRARRLQDFLTHGRYFFTDAIEYDPGAVDRYLRADGMVEHLRALDGAFAELADFDAGSLETALRAAADARGVKAATLIHAVRVAVTGTTVSPGLFEVVALIGKARTHTRLRVAQRLIASSHA
jgi:glutamyl-tRNA synthetase